jgi:DNA-3-methyladenine glycosylase II
MRPVCGAPCASLLAGTPSWRRSRANMGRRRCGRVSQGFPTLVHLILEQQVSIASAAAAFGRLRAALPAFEPVPFLALDDVTLKRTGFSRQKVAYTRELARAVASNAIDFGGFPYLSDADVHAQLTRIKGIGAWTSNVYLLMALGRPDAFPASDIGLLAAAHKIKRLRKRPSPERLERLAESWRPWRAVAARLLWHFYLSEGGPRVVHGDPS